MNRAFSPAVALAVMTAAGCATSASGAASSSSPATASDIVDLVIAATTDVHGRLRGWDYYGNVADSVRG